MALATSPPAPLMVPPTQNTALVLEFRCLYTHDLRRKSKRWQDGFLRFHTFNKRVMVYDLPRNFVGDCHWRGNGELVDGDELELESDGTLVQVGEVIGKTEQDLSGLFEKRQRGGQGQETPRARQAATPLRRPGVGSPTSLRRVLASHNETSASLRQRTTSIRSRPATRVPAPRTLVAESPSVGRHLGTTNRSDARPAKRTKLHDARANIPRQPDLAGVLEPGLREAPRARRHGNEERRYLTSRQIVEVSDDEQRNNRRVNVQAPAEEQELFVSSNTAPGRDQLQPAHPARDRHNQTTAPVIQKPAAEHLRLAKAPPRKKLVCEELPPAPVPPRPSGPNGQDTSRPRSLSPRSKQLSKFHQAQMERLQSRKRKNGRRAEELDFLEQSQTAEIESDRGRDGSSRGNRPLDAPRPAAPARLGAIQSDSHHEGVSAAVNSDRDPTNNPDKQPPRPGPTKQSRHNQNSKTSEQGKPPPPPPPPQETAALHPPAPARPPPLRGPLSRTTSIAKTAYFSDEEEKDKDIGPWSTEAFDLFDWRPPGHVYGFERDS